jgi:FkbM family methyltransferase
VVLDIGANVGYYSVSLGRRLGELGGMLHAFEPVPANFAALSHNLQANDLGRTVVAHEIALGETDGSTGMTREMDRGASTGNAVMMTGEVEAAPGTESTAIVRRLDSLSAELGLRRCDLIKVDIEGAEALFLRGAREFVRRHTPLIFGEFSPSWMPAVGGTYPEVLDLLVPLGYKEYWTKPRGGFSSPAGIRGAYQDVLFVPSRMREELGRRLKSAR